MGVGKPSVVANRTTPRVRWVRIPPSALWREVCTTHRVGSTVAVTAPPRSPRVRSAKDAALWRQRARFETSGDYMDDEKEELLEKVREHIEENKEAYVKMGEI